MSTEFGSVYGRKNATVSEQGYGLVDAVAVTRFAGGSEDGLCLQLTLGGEYIQLDEEGIKKLRRKMKKAYSRKKDGSLDA